MATTLRRRPITKEESSESPTPRDESPEKNVQNGGGTEIKVIHKHETKTKKRRTTFIFLLGSLVGIIAAGFFARSNDLIDFPDIGELSMDSLFDVLPAGLVKDMRDFVVRLPALSYPQPSTGYTATDFGT